LSNNNNNSIPRGSVQRSPHPGTILMRNCFSDHVKSLRSFGTDSSFSRSADLQNDQVRKTRTRRAFLI
jgi:hypothetical protein